MAKIAYSLKDIFALIAEEHGVKIESVGFYDAMLISVGADTYGEELSDSAIFIVAELGGKSVR